MTTAEQLAHHESEVRRLKAELDAERGLVEGEECWKATPLGVVHSEGWYWPTCPVPCFPYTDDGNRKADRAAKMMASLNFEDPPFEYGEVVWNINSHDELGEWTWGNDPLDHDLWHAGRIHATEAEALAWRDKFNSAWTGGKS